jgi:polar amino acid transport system substrate-binding protein
MVLAEMGVDRIDTSLVEFGQLIPGLRAHRFDLTAAGMYITPPRCQQIDFSNPTYCVGEAFLVRGGNPSGLHGYRDVLNDPDVRLGVVSGTVELTIAASLGIPSSQVVIFPDNVTALAGLRIGRIDAFAGTELTIDDALRRIEGDLEKAEPFEQPAVGGHGRNCGAFGFRAEDDRFRREFDDHLAALIGTPEHLALVRDFGFGPDNLPGGASARQLCGAEAVGR